VPRKHSEGLRNNIVPGTGSGKIEKGGEAKQKEVRKEDHPLKKTKRGDKPICNLERRGKNNSEETPEGGARTKIKTAKKSSGRIGGGRTIREGPF